MVENRRRGRTRRLRTLINVPKSGTSFISDDEPAGEKEAGILKLSAVLDGRLRPEKNKRVSSFPRSALKISLRKDTILISRSNTLELVGAVAYVPRDYPNLFLPDLLWELSVQDITVCNPRWLAYMLSSPRYRRELSARANGTSGSMKKLTKPALLNMKVRIPPIDVQDTMVAVLSTWDRGIEQLERLIGAKERRKRGLMQQLLTGKCRFPKFVESWKVRKLGNVFTERTEIDRPDLPLLSITSDRGVIDRSEVDRKDTSNADKARYKRIAPGDIGYNTMRMWQGVSALNTLEGIVSPAYTIVVPGKELVPEFIKHLFKFPPMVHLFYRYSQGLVDDTRNLKFSNFRQIRAILPPVEEQRRIAAVLSACDAELEQHRVQLAALKRQKRALMQKLLTGEVRVGHESKEDGAYV